MREGSRPLARFHRAQLTGILFVLKTPGCVGTTCAPRGGCLDLACWRRLGDCKAAGVWRCLRELPLAKLRAAGRPDRLLARLR
ncbi:putative transposase [Burkholderia lata]|uniref:Transposase n=1 Tax=Burkholderia lata (strain ATCC 17760 / DSM 23089 / LMG 22485 / NCIMB 9086 / R18194 / 383) TaxID=482957 RepID=Q39LV1_BURL3|nr:putative transposase [Burkholderia lata]